MPTILAGDIGGTSSRFVLYEVPIGHHEFIHGSRCVFLQPIGVVQETLSTGITADGVHTRTNLLRTALFLDVEAPPSSVLETCRDYIVK